MKKLIEWFKKWFQKEEEEVIEIPQGKCLTCSNLSKVLRMRSPKWEQKYACKYHGYISDPEINTCDLYELNA